MTLLSRCILNVNGHLSTVCVGEEGGDIFIDHHTLQRGSVAQ